MARTPAEPAAPGGAPARGRGFYPMSRWDRAFILSLLLVALVGFLPWAREVRWAGMVALGWIMAGLMVLSPLVALGRLWLRPRGQEPPPGGTRGEP